MNKPSPRIISLFIIVFIFSTIPTNSTAINESPEEVDTWFKSLSPGGSTRPEKMTKLHFYYHNLFGDKNGTSAHLANANLTGPLRVPFGSFTEADDPLTMGPEFGSKRVGYARGFFGTSSMEEVGLVHATILVFTDGAFNGSTVSVLGYNPIRNLYREMPVVGGTGVFRLARGLSTWQTYFYDRVKGNATVEIHITLLHY